MADEVVPVRTTRQVGVDGKLEVLHIRKDRVNQCFVSILNCDAVAKSAKVIFSTEELLLETDLPRVTSTTNVRIKERKSYYWGNWRFDITKAWSASNYSQATSKRDSNSDTRYEVEIELAEPRSYLDANSTEYVALSLLMKVCGMLPPTAGIAV